MISTSKKLINKERKKIRRTLINTKLQIITTITRSNWKYKKEKVRKKESFVSFKKLYETI